MANIFEELWVEKYRPETLDDLILSKQNKRYFEQMRVKGEIPHLIFSGHHGIGKTSLAKILAKEALNCQYLYINASSESGVDTIRTKVTDFAQTMSFDGKLKMVILDEIDGLSRVKSGNTGTSAQGALRGVIEDYADNTRFVATCNYPNLVIPALRSRFEPYDLTPPFQGVFERCVKILKTEGVKVPEDSKPELEKLIKRNYPDMRIIIGLMHKYTVDGILCLTDDDKAINVGEDILDLIQDKATHEQIREYVIKNEINFNNDYHNLLKTLFEAVYSSKLKSEQKRPALLLISNAMYQHPSVLDKEINFYSCILELLGL